MEQLLALLLPRGGGGHPHGEHGPQQRSLASELVRSR